MNRRTRFLRAVRLSVRGEDGRLKKVNVDIGDVLVLPDEQAARLVGRGWAVFDLSDGLADLLEDDWSRPPAAGVAQAVPRAPTPTSLARLMRRG